MSREKIFFLILRFYPFLLITFLFTYLVRWPIYAGDTDLWYHLNGGRYIIENLSIPKDSFFSFMEPAKEWVDYYWLFQVLTYAIYSCFGYLGLVIFRTAILLSSLILVYFFLKKKHKSTSLFFLALFSLYLLFLFPRFFLIRPHMVSYFFIVVFLYIFETKREKLFLIPIFSLLWVNFHGIEYPVMLLILFAYLVEFLLERKKGHQKKDTAFLLVTFFSILSVLITPHGFRLPHVPFIQTGFASLYINEIRKIAFSDLLSFHFSMLSPSLFTSFNLILLTGLFVFLSNIFGKHIRVSHLILFLGALVLLTKANRFTYEFALLCLPIFRDFLARQQICSLKEKLTEKFLLLFLILVIPFVSLRIYFSNLPPFPFSPVSLPEGVCTFLKKLDIGGNILNHPNTGGYLQFMLYPRYKIFMDMEVPFLFTNEDMFNAINAFTDKTILKEILEKYDPHFITVPIKNRHFKELIKDFSHFKPVFFDEVEVLFANRNRTPDLVETHALRFVDPFSLEWSEIKKDKSGPNYENLKKELLKGLDIYPYCAVKNLILAEIFYEEGLYEKTIFHADKIIKKLPHTSHGYGLKAKALKALKRYDEAEKFFKKALKIDKRREDLWKELALTYYEKENFEKAYEIFKGLTNPFSPETTYKDLYYVIDSAFRSGKIRDAEILLPYAMKKLQRSDDEWVSKYEKLQEEMK